MGCIVLTKQAMAKKCDIILIKNSPRSLVLTFVCMCTSCNTVANSLSDTCGVSKLNWSWKLISIAISYQIVIQFRFLESFVRMRSEIWGESQKAAPAPIYISTSIWSSKKVQPLTVEGFDGSKIQCVWPGTWNLEHLTNMFVSPGIVW